MDPKTIKVHHYLCRVFAINFFLEFNIVMLKKFFIEIWNLKIFLSPMIINLKLQILVLLELQAFLLKAIHMKLLLYGIDRQMCYLDLKNILIPLIYGQLDVS